MFHSFALFANEHVADPLPLPGVLIGRLLISRWATLFPGGVSVRGGSALRFMQGWK